MVKLIEIVKGTSKYSLREVYVNPQHVVYLREDGHIQKALVEGKLPEGLDHRQNFTRLVLENGNHGSEFVVVGSPSDVRTKLLGNKKELLHG